MKLFKILLAAFWLMLCISCEKDTEIMVKPQLTLSADTLNFDNHDTHQLLLFLVPADSCSFKVASYPSWLNISPVEGSIDDEIQVSMSPTDANSAGKYSGNIRIHTRFGESVVFVEKTGTDSESTVSESILLNLPDSVIINEFTDNTVFTFTNESSTSVEWSVKATNDLLTFGQATGTTESRNEENIDITLNREDLETGDYYSDIILSTGSHTDTIPVRISNFKENKIKLTEDIVDVTYSRLKNALVYVSSNPLALYYYDVALDNAVKIDLTYMPTSVGLSKNGEFAVVGHDAHVTYVDLVNKKVLKTIDVPGKIADIVLADNGWAYGSPADYTGYLHCINLTEGYVVPHTGYTTSAYGKIILDITGKYIYLANNGVSPSDLEKYGIQNDTAKLLYDSPYHGDYRIDGDLWLSEDGNRIFTRGGSVFKTSEEKSLDMTYNGELDLYGENNYILTSVFGLDHNANTQKVYLIAAEGYDVPKLPYLFIHNYDNLLLSEKVNLEKYITKDGNGGGAYYEPDPRFVFSNTSGDEVYVITKAYESGLLYEWAIQKIAVK